MNEIKSIMNNITAIGMQCVKIRQLIQKWLKNRLETQHMQFPCLDALFQSSRCSSTSEKQHRHPLKITKNAIK